MAKKIRSAAARPAPGRDAEELDILHPERALTLAGRDVVVREYGAVEFMRLLPAARPLVDAIAGLLETGTVPGYDAALDVLAAHIDGLLPLIAQAADLTPADLGALNPDEFELLLMTWWGTNGRFFIGRATNRVAVALAERRLTASAGGNSMPPSSPTATTSGASVATPSGS